MPQSTAALRQKAETLRVLRNPHAVASGIMPGGPVRPVRSRVPFVCQPGTCLALEVRSGALWVQVCDHAGQEAWAPIHRILNPEQRREWARGGFGAN